MSRVNLLFVERADDVSFAFVEYETPQQALKACKNINRTAIDKRHTLGVNKITDIERYGREGRIDDEYAEPELEEYHEKEHLRWWLGDPNCRDQFVLYRADGVQVCWNKKRDNPEIIVERQHWTEKFVTWSPFGTYLATMHVRGMQLWGGPSWTRQTRFPHPGVELIDFSPNEKYLCTWSYKPIEVAEDDPVLSEEEDGKHYIIWDLATGRVLRSFGMYDLATAPIGPDGQPVKKQLPWPTFKWSADDKYVARMKEGEGIHVYELPSMKMMDKKPVRFPDTPSPFPSHAHSNTTCLDPHRGHSQLRMVTRNPPTARHQKLRTTPLLLDARNWQQSRQSRPPKHPLQRNRPYPKSFQRHRRETPLAISGRLRLRKSRSTLQVKKELGHKSRNLSRARKRCSSRSRRQHQRHRHQLRMGA